MPILKNRRIRRARAAILSRREKREHYIRAIEELAALAVQAIDTPTFENRSAYVRDCLTMIREKSLSLGAK